MEGHFLSGAKAMVMARHSLDPEVRRAAQLVTTTLRGEVRKGPRGCLLEGEPYTKKICDVGRALRAGGYRTSLIFESAIVAPLTWRGEKPMPAEDVVREFPPVAGIVPQVSKLKAVDLRSRGEQLRRELGQLSGGTFAVLLAMASAQIRLLQRQVIAGGVNCVQQAPLHNLLNYDRRLLQLAAGRALPGLIDLVGRQVETAAHWYRHW